MKHYGSLSKNKIEINQLVIKSRDIYKKCIYICKYIYAWKQYLPATAECLPHLGERGHAKVYRELHHCLARNTAAVKNVRVITWRCVYTKSLLAVSLFT